MKYHSGDWLSFKTPGGLVYAGLIHSKDESRYMLALADYQGEREPSPGFFETCDIFAIEYAFDDKSIYSLDGLTMDGGFIDASPDITLIGHTEIGMIGISGFLWMQDLAALVSFVKERESMFADNILRIGRRMSRRFQDFIVETPPRNEYPTVKLYKKDGDGLAYCQVYVAKEAVVVHWGMMGGYGLIWLSQDKDVYGSEIGDKEAKGYSREIDAMPMVLQFGTSDGWGTPGDLDFRHEFDDYLNTTLFWTANGRTTGGDIGSGTVNIFLEAVDVGMAVDSIVQMAREKGGGRPFLVAREGDQKVIYPADYEGEFMY